MRSALRHLCEHGASALKAQKVMTKPIEHGSYIARTSKPVWRRPLLSKRVANTIRKQAIDDGTYGTFNVDTGIGWDPTWDVILFANRYAAVRPGKLQPNKKTSRERGRESRAQKIEQNLETRLQTMEEYYTEKEQSRIEDLNFEARFKRMMGKGGGTGGGGR